MLLENAEGDLTKRALPPADPSGELMIVLGQNSAPDQAFLRLISDPDLHRIKSLLYEGGWAATQKSFAC